MLRLLNSLSMLNSKTVLAAVFLLICGALLKDFIPFLWHKLVSFCTWCGRRIGGKFAFRYFERIYLDWLVTQLRELKLTGIVTTDPSKKPRLEQVFLSLRMGGDREGISFMDCASAVCAEIKRNPRKRRSLLESLKKDIEKAPLDQRKDVEEYIERSIGERKSTKLPRLILLLDGFGAFLFRRSDIFSKFLRTLLARITFDGISFETEANESDYLSTLFNQILRDNQRLAILGPPGSGKSTLLQYIGLAYAKARAGDPKLRRANNHRRCLGASKWRLPVFIPLSAVSKSLAEPLTNGNRRTILDVLPSILPPDLQKDPLVTKFFQRKLLAGECIVLFDGLDEVPTEDEFKAVVNCIESFTIAHPKNQYIATSRIAGWRSGIHADFKVFYLADLTDPQIDSFISIWCEAVEQNAVIGRLQDEGQADNANRRRKAQHHASQLRSAIQSNGGMRQLASNPMLLSIIALVHHSLPDLPKERTKLYSDCSKILLEQWDMSKGRRVDDTHLRLEQKESILRCLAFALHTGEIGKQGGSREADRTEVEKLISTLLPSFNMPSEDAARLLSRLVERSGIIVERQRNKLAFSHLTFQEYFVALHLAKNKLGSFLLQDSRLFTDWWREIAVMYSGLLDDSSEFLKALYGCQYSDLFSTKLLLAGMCLGEAQVVRQVTIRESICADLARLRTLGSLSSSHADFRDLSGYLTDWSRSESARRHAMAFAISCASNSEQRTRYLERLESTIRDGDPEVVRLCISALQLLPQLSTERFTEAVCSQIGKQDSRTSTNCLHILSKSLPETSSEALTAAFETALQDSDATVRSTALSVLSNNADKSDLHQKLQTNIEKLLYDKNWRVRQSAVEAYSEYVRMGTQGSIARLFELIDKEDDDDVLDAAFKVLNQNQKIPSEDSERIKGLTRLTHGKSEKVRSRALDSITDLLNIPERVDEVCQTAREFISSRSDNAQNALVKSLQRLHNPASIQECTKRLTVLVDIGSPIERANALRLLGVLREYIIKKDEIDRLLVSGLRSKRRSIRVGAADGIWLSKSWPCGRESYSILISMALASKAKVKLSALRAIAATITPARGPETVEVLRRGVMSDSPEIREAAAKAASRMGKAGAELKSVFMDQICGDRLFSSLFYFPGGTKFRQIMSLLMFTHDYTLDLNAYRAFRGALVSLTNSKGDVQRLVEEISKKIENSRKPHLAVIPLVQVIGDVAEKYTSLKALECVIQALHLLDEGLDDINILGQVIYFGSSLAMALNGASVFQSEIVAVGKRLQGRDVVKCVKQALESQGSLTKTALLPALPEFESSVRLELIPTLKDIANNDVQRWRDIAWESLKSINVSRGAWIINEAAILDGCK